MKTLLTIIPFWFFFTSIAIGQISGKIPSIQADTIRGSVFYIGTTPYKITAATNLWGPAAYMNNNTIFTGSGIEWLMSNHPFVLQLRSDLDKLIAKPVPVVDTAAINKLRKDYDSLLARVNALQVDNTKLKTDVPVISTDVTKLKTDMTSVKSSITKISNLANSITLDVDSLFMIKPVIDTLKTIIDKQQQDIQILKTDSLNTVFIKLSKGQTITGRGTSTSPYVIK